jgi:histidinol-phosphate aminotransferase
MQYPYALKPFKMDILQLARNNIKSLVAYSSARSLYTKGILMDANENPYSPPGTPGDLNRYPDGSNRMLRELLSERLGLNAERCAAGNGSDELLDLLFRIFCEPGRDKVLITSPTYGMYGVLAATHDIEVLDVPLLDGFTLNMPEILRVLPSVKIVFLCRPNNPTGNVFSREDILRILEERKCLVVVDEAYAEFMKEESLVTGLDDYPNLVVLKTLSKAFALAGARLGYMLAAPEVIGLVQKTKLPYNISALTATTVISVLQGAQDNSPATLLEERGRMMKALSELPGVQAFPSEANFILFRVKDADKVCASLASAGIIIRSRTSQIPGCLRVSIGTPEQNRLFLQQLNDILSV